jgi:hypothetical protein
MTMTPEAAIAILLVFVVALGLYRLCCRIFGWQEE